jgi:hypothetical protein
LIYFNSEYVKDYGNYSFGYARYAIREEGDRVDKILEGGFLPYTGDPTLQYPLYYLSRSLRINLAKYEAGSENRRVNRKFEGRGFSFEWSWKKASGHLIDGLRDLALNFSRQRFSTGQMPKDRFDYIFDSPAGTDLMLVKKDGKLVAYVLCGKSDLSLHYWFSFYDTTLVEWGPFGKWIMWKAIEWSKERGLKYVYLGTCYGSKALYKARDFKGAEYYDGTLWSDDMKALKALCKKDKSHHGIDAFKAREDRNDYLERFIRKRIEIK